MKYVNHNTSNHKLKFKSDIFNILSSNKSIFFELSLYIYILYIYIYYIYTHTHIYIYIYIYIIYQLNTIKKIKKGIIKKAYERYQNLSKGKKRKKSL